MEETRRLTVASTWRLDREGVDEVRAYYKSSPNGLNAFCKYESNNDVVTIENCDISLSTSPLAKFIASFVDDEKDNDLLEKQKISRIVVPAVADEEEIDVDSDNEGPLIDVLFAHENANIPISIKYWRTKNGGIECFAKAPRYILSQLSNITGAQAVLEIDNKRIRVSSASPTQVDDALEKLSNLERSLSQMSSPQVVNILHVGNEKEFRLRLPIYRTINELALRRILVDPDSKLVGHLSRMAVTLMEFTDPDSQASESPANIANPPRPTEARKGRSRVWSEYKFAELGDSTILPDIGGLGKLEAEQLETPQVLNTTAAEDTIVNDHPHLSREKVSLVNKWVADGLEAGAVGTSGSEPNSALATEPSTQTVEAPKIITGVKKRKVLPVGNDSNSVPSVPTPVERSTPMDATRNEVLSNELGSKITRPLHDSRKYGDPETAGKPKTNGNNQTRLENFNLPKDGAGKQGSGLIDVFDVEIMPSGTNIGLMSHDQQPLIPSKPMIGKSTTDTKLHTHLSKMDLSAKESPQLKVLTNGNKVEGSREQRLRNLRPTLQSGVGQSTLCIAVTAGQGADRPKTGISDVKEREQKTTEVSSRVFHRTMGQRAPALPSKRVAKNIQKSKKEAAIAEAWGAPLPPVPISSSSKRDNPEPSMWKKAQLEKEARADRLSAKDIFSCLHPMLDAARYFTGTVSVALQFGLILIHSIDKPYVDRALDTKGWDRLFRPHHGLRGPTTTFINRLTTSGADIDYILGLNSRKGTSTPPNFAADPSSRYVCYEFHCQTKNNETIVINVDEAGITFVNKPEVMLGSVNVHSPRNIWDLRTVVKGTQEYSRGFDKEVDNAVQFLIDNLYVFPDRARLLMFTRIPENNELCVTKVLMRRSTRHRFIGRESASLTKAPNQKTEQVYLQVTEVQNLVFAHTPVDKTAIRIRALGPEEMVENSRLWYEASIVSPVIEKALESNKNLEIGGCVDTWQASHLLGEETGLTEEDNDSNDATSKASSDVGSAGIGQMFRVAKSMLDKIDGVGWANNGPAVDATDNILHPPPHIGGRPGLSFGMLNCSTPTEHSRHGMVGATMVENSYRNTVPGPEEFW